MNFIKKLFNKKPQLTVEQQLLIELSRNVIELSYMSSAVARLQFIKPETLAREINDRKANADFLVKLNEHLKNETSK